MANRDPLRGREPAVSVTWGQVCGWRLAQQHVTHPDSDPITVAAALGGVQAQVTASAQFTLGRRSTAIPEDIERALWVDRRLVKTWAMRGTLHWLPAEEYPLWVAALRAREWRITPGWEKYHGVTKAELDAITEAIPEALEGRQLTRDELADRLAEVTRSPHLAEQLRSGWGAVLKPGSVRRRPRKGLASGAGRCAHRRRGHVSRYRVALEASGFLVGPTVFKTDEPVLSRLAGSIPVRLRLIRPQLATLRRCGLC